MTPELKDRIAKIYELVKNGGTEGEKQAAKLALDRILSKYNLEGMDMDELDKNDHTFSYVTEMEIMLFERIVSFFAQNSTDRIYYGRRMLRVRLTYMDYITVSASYEYFRRHMKAQWNKFCANEISRLKSVKTKNKRRKELQKIFISRYVIASKLYKEGEIKTLDSSKMSAKEIQDRNKMSDVVGGQYTTQIVGGKMLNQTN